MKVTTQKNKKPEQEAELFVAGSCMGLEVAKGTMYRIALTPSQWRLLAESAAQRAKELRT